MGYAVFGIENNADLNEVNGSVIPKVISRNVDYNYEVQIRNDGTSDVILNSNDTYFTFGLDTFALDTTTVGLPGGTTTTIKFISNQISSATGKYSSTLYIDGNEYSNLFVDTLFYTASSDSITVEEPPLLTLDSFTFGNDTIPTNH